MRIDRNTERMEVKGLYLKTNYLPYARSPLQGTMVIIPVEMGLLPLLTRLLSPQ